MPIKSCYHISKNIESLNNSTMLLFVQCSWPTSFLLFYPFLCCIFFCTELPYFPHLLLYLVYLSMWCSMLSLMLRLVLLLVVPEAICGPVLACAILVGQLNKIFGFITQTIKSLHGLYCMVFKNMCFWCYAKSKIAPGLHGGRKKAPLSLILSQVGPTFRKHEKAP